MCNVNSPEGPNDHGMWIWTTVAFVVSITIIAVMASGGALDALLWFLPVDTD